MSGFISLSLGVQHPDVDPAQITRELGVQPQHSWRKGEPRRDEAGGALGGTHRDSYWLCEITLHPTFPGEPTGVQNEVSHLLQILRRSITFMQSLQFGGGSAELRITAFAQSTVRIELLPEEAALIGRLGVAMTVEVNPYAAATTSAA